MGHRTTVTVASGCQSQKASNKDKAAGENADAIRNANGSPHCLRSLPPGIARSEFAKISKSRPNRTPAPASSGESGGFEELKSCWKLLKNIFL